MITELEGQLSSVCNGMKKHEALVDVTQLHQLILSNKDSRKSSQLVGLYDMGLID